MDKRKESIADIVAEMRMGSPVKPGAYRIGLADKITVLESGNKMRTIQIKTVTVKEIADRIEAAAKREEAQHGNAAAMREALEEARKVIKAMGGYWARITLPIIDAALAAPARNCDVGTAEEQAERYMKFCKNYPKCTGCPCVGRMQYHQCEFAWEQLPDNEGSAK